MSSLINKVKEAVHSDKKDNTATDDPRSTNAGPHSSNMANKADPRVDSDRDNIHSTGGIGATGTHGAHTTHTHGAQGTTGIGSTGGGYGGPGNPQSGNAGPHSSNLANKADPRIDSDLDGGRNVGGAGGFGTTGTSGIGGAGHGHSTHHQSTTAGPHSSNLANKADPRVDSDLDGSRGLGGSGVGHGGANTGAGYGGANTGAGYGGPGNPQSSNAGPHSSNIGNRADPRVDSDLDGGRHAGLNTSGGGYGSHTTQTGGVGGVGAHGSSATPGSGNASKTAGPHNSDLLNKIDPRVDSDLDGSKTYGGNQTHR